MRATANDLIQIVDEYARAFPAENDPTRILLRMTESLGVLASDIARRGNEPTRDQVDAQRLARKVERLLHDAVALARAYGIEQALDDEIIATRTAAPTIPVTIPVGIRLVDPDPAGWAQRFEAERRLLQATAPGVSVEHIGSTAVPGLPAKDAVDVLVGVIPGDVGLVTDSLVSAGYLLEGRRRGHAWLSRLNRATVVHVMEWGSARWRDRIRFRDVLRESAPARAEYLAAKREAAATSTSWDDYTPRKAEAVERLLASVAER